MVKDILQSYSLFLIIGDFEFFFSRFMPKTLSNVLFTKMVCRLFTKKTYLSPAKHTNFGLKINNVNDNDNVNDNENRQLAN